MAGLSLSVFEIIGPVMVGPSSSHTAGAVRLGLVANRLLGGPPRRALIALGCSFAATGRGHATDRALIFGLLGRQPDDPALSGSFALAQEGKMQISFEPEVLGDDVHPNSVRMHLVAHDRTLQMTGASLGGGVIEVSEIDGCATSFNMNRSTLVLWHDDVVGFLANVTAILAGENHNIAALRTTRRRRGDLVLTVVEMDRDLSEDILRRMQLVQGVETLRALPSFS